MSMMGNDEVGLRLRLQDRARFSSDIGHARRDIEGIGTSAKRTDRNVRDANRGLGAFRAGLRGVRAAAKITVVGLGAAGTAAAAFGIKSIKLAMDAEETASKFRTVFGDATRSVSRFIDQTNRRFGIPTKELQDAASVFGVFGKAAGVPQRQLGAFSTSLVQAGLDLGSFYNVEPGEVFESLRSGLAGETEPLRRFGIFITEDTLKAKALEMGLGKTKVSGDKLRQANLNLAIAHAKAKDAVAKHGAHSLKAAQANLNLQRAQSALQKVTKGGTVQLTEAQKVAVRQRLILDQLADAQGDLARTSGSLANQWRALKGRFTEAGTAIGKSLMPMANDVVTWGNKKMLPIIDKIEKRLPGMVERFRSRWADFRAALAGGDVDTAVAGFDTLVGAGGRLEGVVNTLRDAWTEWKPTIESAVDVAGTFANTLYDMRRPLAAVMGFIADHPNLTLFAAGLYLVARAALFTKSIMMGYLAVKLLLAGTGAADAALGAFSEGLRGEALAAKTAQGALRGWTGHIGRFVGGIKDAVVGGARFTISIVKNTAATMANKAASVATAAATKAWTAAQWLLNAALNANPISLVVIAIAALVAGFILAYKHSETFRNIVHAALGAVVGAGRWVIDFFRNNWPLLLTIILGPFGLAIAGIIKYRSGIIKILRGAIDWVRNNWDILLTIITGPFGLAILAVRRFKDQIISAVKAGLNFLIRGWNSLEFKIPGFDPPGPGPKFGGFTLGVPDIPELHTGGTALTRGVASIRPDEEMVILPPRASVVPLPEGVDNTGDLNLGSRGPVTVQVVLDRKVIAEAVYDEARDEAARK